MYIRITAIAPISHTVTEDVGRFFESESIDGLLGIGLAEPPKLKLGSVAANDAMSNDAEVAVLKLGFLIL